METNQTEGVTRLHGDLKLHVKCYDPRYRIKVKSMSTYECPIPEFGVVIQTLEHNSLTEDIVSEWRDHRVVARFAEFDDAVDWVDAIPIVDFTKWCHERIYKDDEE